MQILKKFFKLYQQDSKILYRFTMRLAFYLSGSVIGLYICTPIIDSLPQERVYTALLMVLVICLPLTVVASIIQTVGAYELKHGKINLD